MLHLNKGFTYVELVVTLAILLVLASISMPLMQLNNQRVKEQQLAESLRQIRTAIDEYKRLSDAGNIKKSADVSGYPPNLDVLVNGVVDVRSIERKKIYLLRRLPQDPIYAEVYQERDNWGKRSYQSPPDAPTNGDDVYDVYSLADGVGINGVEYRDW